MKCGYAMIVLLASGVAPAAAQPAPAKPPARLREDVYEGKQPPERVNAKQGFFAFQFEDQFARKACVDDLRGAVVVLVYGDRKGTESCRVLGEGVHVAFHPTASGTAPGKARLAPAATAGPDVVVVPVACCGNVPSVVKGLIRSQVAKASPEVVVWLDFQGVMKMAFGVAPGGANVAVLDVGGRIRHVQRGVSDVDTVVKWVQTLRDEATPGADNPNRVTRTSGQASVKPGSESNFLRSHRLAPQNGLDFITSSHGRVAGVSSMSRSTRRRGYTAVWVFVAAVTAWDICWALAYRETSGDWESNPVMRWVMFTHGVSAAAFLRFATVAFSAALMIVAPRRCRLAATGIIAAAHAYLAVAYALILWWPETP